jgi:hypothetical protein
MVQRIGTNWKDAALGKLKNECVRVHGNENITFRSSFLDHSVGKCTSGILYYVRDRNSVF